MKKTSKAIEDYLEAFYILYKNKEPLESARVSRLLNVSRPAVNKATHELLRLGFINKTPYSEIEFTPAGKRIAKRVYHRHTTLKKYLLSLGVSEKNADRDCCLIEHVLSEETFKKIEALIKDKNH
ncbi:MAG: metal-dependent transcriptional regulator [Bacilli bacterium]|jgi:Mn-dependent DtxR family transcriptional regulator|nr:metal-dependent transcriptional regulator [Bacilli bacterium]